MFLSLWSFKKNILDVILCEHVATAVNACRGRVKLSRFLLLSHILSLPSASLSTSICLPIQVFLLHLPHICLPRWLFLSSLYLSVPQKNASESIYRFAASLPAVAAGKPSGNTPARWWNGRRGEAYSSTQWSCQWWMPVRGGLLASYGKSSLAIQGCTERPYMTPDIKLNWSQSSGFALKNKKCCQEVLPFLSSLHFIFLRLALDRPC